MPLVDLPLSELRTYRPTRTEPHDFDDFWRATLAEASGHALNPVFAPHEARLAMQVWDVRFSGFAGERIGGWFLAPRHVEGPLPCIVQYLGYSTGRGYPHEWLLWPAAGYGLLVMDTRGQGNGITADPHGGPHPQEPGFLTRGVLDRWQYYYRRLFTDAVRAVDAAAAHPLVDPCRIVVAGASQGGAVAQAVAALHPTPFAAMIDIPFLTHVRRATDLTDEPPYAELVRYLAKNRDKVDDVFATISYFDGLNFAARALKPALYSVGLMDALCLPSTVFAAHNHYAGRADIQVWTYNGHEGGGSHQQLAQLAWLQELLS